MGYSFGESGDREAAEALERQVRSRAPAIRRCIELSPERLELVWVVLDERAGARCDLRRGGDYHAFPCCQAVFADLRDLGTVQRFDISFEVERVP